MVYSQLKVCRIPLYLHRFATKNHGDSHPFDGAGNVLAHTFHPEDGDIHLDDDETFTTSASASGIHLSWVMLHEIGHALGNIN